MGLPGLDHDVVFSNHDKFFPLSEGETSEILPPLRAVSQDREDSRRVREGGFHRNEEGHDSTWELRVGRVHQDGSRLPLAVIRGAPPLDRRQVAFMQRGLEGDRCESPDQQRMSSASQRSDPSRGFQAQCDGCELEPDFHLVIGCSVKIVHHHPVPGLDEEDAAPVHDRIGKATIGVVLGVCEVVGLRGAPLA